MSEVHIMKLNKIFLAAVLPTLAVSLLTGCSKSAAPSSKQSSFVPAEDDEEEEIIYEIGDTVREWTSISDYEEIPLGIATSANNGTGKGEIVNDFGHNDSYSLKYEVKVGNNQQGYISSDALEKPYFNDNHAKNGDIISLCYYVPANSNVASLQLQVVPSSGNNAISSDLIAITDDNVDKWARTLISFDTLETMGSIRVIYKAVDSEQDVTFFIDDINIEYGAETVKTGYEYKDESLYKSFEDYFTVGTCMSANYVRNTKFREITKHNFNSVTAENEAKPDSTLDQAACQELAKTDETAVAISTKSFEKIYDWCEANHIKVRHHTFVWHQQTPSWFFNKGYQSNGQQVSRDVMIGRLNNFLKTTIETLDERWPGLVYALDVVNEAIVEVNQMRGGNWMDTIGDDYIYQAFLAANQYKKDYQEVYYNDYAFDQKKWGGIERCQWACDELLKKVIDEELIDGIGIQAHIEEPAYADAVIEDAKIICKAGIKCQITELDINISGNSEEAFNDQKDLYKKIVKAVLEGNDNGTMDVNAIIVWGITDDTSWHRSNYPLMFDSNYAKKPAYYGFLEALEEFEENQ